MRNKRVGEKNIISKGGKKKKKEIGMKRINWKNNRCV